MKRSRSGTRSSAPAKAGRRQALGLTFAVLAVLAFVASFVFGLGRGERQGTTPAPAVTTLPVAVPDSRVRVEVLNGSRKAGLARVATEKLRDAGYDVVFLGNAPNAAKTSVVIDRVGKRETADKIAKVLGITAVRAERDTTRYLEVTVILGSDFRR